MMSLKEALRICWSEKLTDHSGRACRSEFWWFAGFVVIIDSALFCLGLGVTDLGRKQMGEDPGFLLYAPFLIVTLATLYPTVAVAIRRLHDRGLSGFLLLLVLLGGVLLVLSHFYPSLTVSILIIDALIVVTFLGLFLLPGNRGANRYGEDPLMESAGEPQNNDMASSALKASSVTSGS